MKIRLTFSKNSHAQHASHLDILRAFTRSFARANLPLAYSTGFNPHASLTFALPLPVSTTSECEIVDCQLTSPIAPQSLQATLNQYLPSGLTILHAEETESKLPKITRAEYLLEIQAPSIPIPEIQTALTLPELPVEKRTKSGTKEINVLQHLHHFQILSHTASTMSVQLICDAGSEFNLKPNLVIQALSRHLPEFQPTNVEIHRTALISQ